MNINMRRPFEGMLSRLFGDTRHNYYHDFGFPERVGFGEYYNKFQRNGLARAAVDRTINKTWQTNPWLLEKQPEDRRKKDSDETTLEADIRTAFRRLRFWQVLREADRRSMVGEYAAVIFRFRDDGRFSDEVTRVGGGLEGLAEIVPAWQSQLTVSEYDMDDRSDTYGQPLMFEYNEGEIGNGRTGRQFKVHPSRVFIWSNNGTMLGEPALQAGYNDLLTMEKIVGSGGEGFWKNARSNPVLEIDHDADPAQMAALMGVETEDVPDKLDEMIEDYQRGFNKVLMLQRMKATTLGVTLPIPDQFFAVALQGFAASLNIPMKILVGSQTGERASTEDAAEWAQTCSGRRVNETIPNISGVIQRLEDVGIIPQRDWFLDWSDLTESTAAEKIERALKMADINQRQLGTGETAFTNDELREVVGYEPLEDSGFGELDDEGN